MKAKIAIIFILISLTFLTLKSSNHKTTLQTANELYERVVQQKNSNSLKDFDHKDRTSFAFIPTTRTGLPLKEMSAETKGLTFILLQELLSESGFKKASNILELEDILRETEGRPVGNDYRDPGKYYLNFFGKPNAKNPWSISFEGHHLSLNFSFIGEKMTGTPMFIGANPAEVRIDRQKGWRVLEEEEDLGWMLLNSLDQSQLKQALISDDAPYDITSGTDSSIAINEFEGILYTQLRPEQKQMLKELVLTYTRKLSSKKADEYLKKIESWGWESLWFAWEGSLKKGKGHYYKVMGPTLLIEYDNTQNEANHIHTVWRDSEEDFGRNLLKEHYANSPHHQK